MAVNVGSAYLEIIPSAKGFSSKLQGELGTGMSTAGGKAGDTAAKGFGTRFKSGLKTAAKAGAVALAAGLAVGAKFAGDAISAASDLSETLNKSNTIFGKNAGTIEAWSKTAASSMGLSQQAALEAAAGFGDMFSQIGFGGDQAAKMSKSVVQMSADLGSFNNLPTADVSERISAAFRGEYDSLQALIPNINAARVEQEAMAATGKKSATQLTAQEKAAAVLAIVQKDGARAMGDFAKTSGGLANQQKILGARFDDLKAAIGSRLLPVATKLTTWAVEFVKGMQDGTGAGGTFVGVLKTAASVLASVAGFIKRNSDVIVPLVAALAAGALAFKIISAVTKAWAAAQVLLNLALTANPIGIVIVAVAALVAALVVAYKNSETFRNIVNGAFQAVKKVASAVFGWLSAAVSNTIAFVRAHWKLILAILTGPVGAAAIFIISNFGKIKAAGTSVVDWIKGIPGKLKALGSLFADAGKALIGKFVDGLANAAGVIGGIAGNVWDSVKGLLNKAIDKINAALEFTINLPGPDIHINPANIPHLAGGGRATGATLAVIGEGREAETVLPDSMLRGLLTRAADGGRGGSGGGNTYNLHEVMDASKAAREIARYEAFAGGS